MKDVLILILALSVLGLLVKLKVNIGIAIFASAFAILIPSKVSALNVTRLLFYTAISRQTIYLVLIVIIITYFAELLKVSGFLEEMVKSFSSYFTAKVFIPLFAFIIGSLPMPGGALVSAPLVEKGSEYTTLNNAEKTAVNFWFRHIWEPTSPLYPEMILASSILGVPVLKIIEVQWIYSFLMLLSGVIFLVPLIKTSQKMEVLRNKQNLRNIFLSTMPIIVVLALIIAFRVSIVVSGMVGIIYIAIMKKTDYFKFKQALNTKLLLKLTFLMYAIMFLKYVSKSSGVITGVYSYLNAAHVPDFIIIYSLPFIVSLMGGAASATIGVSYPLLLPLLKTPNLNIVNLLIAFLGGWSALMLTPTHLCLSLSIEYFEAKPSDVYKILIKTVLFLTVLSITYILIVKTV